MEPVELNSQETIDQPTAENFPITEKVHAHDEMPPSLYREAHKVPLVLDLVGGSSAYSHFDMTPLTNEVDQYISEEILRQGLEDTKTDYQQVLNEALDHLELPEGIDIYTMIEKLVKYFRIQHKLATALKEKEELMQKDPLDMNSAQLKRYLAYQHGI